MNNLFDFLNITYLLVFFLLCLLIFIIFIVYDKMTPFVRYDDEKYFLDVTKEPPVKIDFPSLEDDASLSLSIIVPAYNEEQRLPTMLDECLRYLEERLKRDSFSYEIIIVNDGSNDNTTDVALNYTRKFGPEKVKVLTLVKNRGKGGAVKLGILSCQGRYILFADADGATKFTDIEKLEREMNVMIVENTNAVVIGSRAHLEKQAIASRSIFRTFLMYGFHALVWIFGVRVVRDTQCGFKLFSREAARLLFPALHVERWAFDVELLYLAENMNMIIKEVAVNWMEIEGSKLVPFWSWLQMGKDLLLIWLKYQLHIWTIPSTKKHK